MTEESRFLREALELAYANVEKGGRPFGAVVVRNGAVLATGVNEILSTNDPTAHAELSALRAASRALGTADLSGCAVYASGHPCPMCLAAMRLAGIGAVTYAYSNDEGAPFGLSTAVIYADLARPFADQAMKIRHSPVRLASHPELYAAWQARQGDRAARGQ
jgi:tRNA(Arg) A34 adenosine deaminase TadA